MTGGPTAHTEGGAGARAERRGILGSMAATGALGALGIAWGIASGSQMILLDGAYALIGIALSALLLYASRVSRLGPTARFQYGREAATPLAIAVQALVLAGTLLYAALEAVSTIRDGGSSFAPGWAILYAAIVTGACIVVWLWLRTQGNGSDLVVAETIAWRVAAFRGLGMIAGFSVMWALLGSHWEDAAPYVDPVMVLVTCVVFVSTPTRMVLRTIHELLEGAPPAAVEDVVRGAVAEAQERYRLVDPSFRVAKVGPKLYVEVDAYGPADLTIAAEHEARSLVRRRLDTLPYEIWLTFELAPQT